MDSKLWSELTRKGKLKNIFWWFWRRKKTLSFIFFASSVGSIYIAIGLLEADDTLDMIKKVIELLQIVSSMSGAANWGKLIAGSTELIFPILITVIATFLFKYLLFPGSISEVLEAIRQRKSTEIGHLAQVLIKREIETIRDIVSTSNTGCDIATYKVQDYAESIVSVATSNEVFMTTLKKPSEIFNNSNIKAFNERILREIKNNEKKLTRIIISESNETREVNYDGIKWFRDLHNNGASVTVKWMSLESFKKIANGYHEDIRKKLDVLLFDGKLLFALQNDTTTYEVALTPDTKNLKPGDKQSCRLYLIDEEEKLKYYKEIFETLIQNSEDAW
jgi:hypothetical protein